MPLDADACYRALATRDARFDGRLFVGVRTTGIYCRPICPARTPQRENVAFYASAAAAQEAGFRPCLRCRPETAPGQGAWCGTSSTVSRALALIEAGALDGGDTAGLAARLGVGDRQLRRLFRRHLGASPIAVAQTRRVLLAVQLVHETGLPLADVALAAGFGSLRRFNEVFRGLYGAPPSTLRRAAAGAGESLASAISLALAARPPYDWEAVLGFLRLRAIPGVESVGADCYERTIDVEGGHGTLRVERDSRSAGLRARLRLPSVAAMPAMIARVRRLFDLDADPAAIGAHLATDERLAPLVDARPGLRVPGAWDGFELAVRAILGQQITVAAAAGLAGRLVRAHGEPLRLDGAALALTHTFPRPERLARADLASLGMPAARARAISALAGAALEDPHLFDPGPDLESSIARLCALPGIGPWTAHYIAMRALGEPDAFPTGDIGLLRALAGPDGSRPTSVALETRAAAWRPWRAYAALHLWNGGSERAGAKVAQAV